MRARRQPSEYVVPRVGSRPAKAIVWVAEQAFMILVVFVMLTPFYAMVVTSLRRSSDFTSSLASISPPRNPTFENYVLAWTDLGFSSLMKNTVILSLTTTLVTTVVAVIAGFALARLRFGGRRPILVGVIAVMSVPPMVVIVPLFLGMVKLGVINTYPAAIVAEIGLNIPFGTYLIYTFMRDIPEDLFQAAQIEGASVFRQLRSVAIPLSRPVILTVALITAMFSWNDLLVPLVLWQSEDLRVLMVGLANLAPGRQGGVDVPLVMAGVAISVVPVVAAFLLTRRFFVRGLVEGALK